MRVLFTSIRDTGHFQPLVPFLEACRGAGHEVAVAAPRELAERATRTGAHFFEFGHPGDAVLRPIWNRLQQAAQGEANAIVVGEIFAGADAGAALPLLLQSIASWRPDVIVREAQEYAALVAAERAGVPHVRVGISLSRLDVEAAPWVEAPLDAHRAALGLPADPGGARIARERVLTQFPASMDPPTTFPGGVSRYRAPRRAAGALPAWWGDRAEPLVYATLGTIAGGMELARGAYRLVLDAVGKLPVRVLLTTGAELPMERLGDVPPNVHVERFVPQEDVLPHAAAVVCHGGSGTTLGTLAAGVPLVVTPQFADQPMNAERVAAIGAGVALPVRCQSSDDIRGAIERVLGDATLREGALRVAAEMAALPPMEAAVEELVAIARGA